MPECLAEFITEKTTEYDIKTGRGLSWYVTRKIIELQRGKIWMGDNKDAGGGATITFTLPLI
jgi:signal transduction histidine kinase